MSNDEIIEMLSKMSEEDLRGLLAATALNLTFRSQAYNMINHYIQERLAD